MVLSGLSLRARGQGFSIAPLIGNQRARVEEKENQKNFLAVQLLTSLWHLLIFKVEIALSIVMNNYYRVRR